MNDTNISLSEADVRECFSFIKERLPVNHVLQYMQMIGVSKQDFDNAKQFEPSPSQRIDWLLINWANRCGGLTLELRNFLKIVLKEVTSSQRNRQLDDMIFNLRKMDIYNNRNMAWLLFAVAKYYFDQSLFLEKVRKHLQVRETNIQRIRNDHRHDILEARYEILRYWLDERRVERIESVQDIHRVLEGMGFAIPADGLPSIQPSIEEANARGDDPPAVLPADVEERGGHAFVDGNPPSMDNGAPLNVPSTPGAENVSILSSQRPTQRVTPIQQETSMSGGGPSIERGYPVQQATDSSDDEELDLT